MEKKTSTVRARIAPQTKKEAEKILEKLGLTSTQAINLFFHQIILHRGMPFEVQISPSESSLEKDPPLEGEKDEKGGFLFFGRKK